MKQRIFWISLLGLLLFSCKKDKVEHQEDHIVYTDINPDKEIHTVEFYTFQDHGICTAYVPTPKDSIVNYELDLDGDQVPDFNFRVSHSEYTTNYCGHCDVFTYSISIQGLSVNDSIAQTTGTNPISKLFGEGDVIDNNNTWLSNAQLVLYEGCALPFQTDFTSGYIGVKIKNSYGYIRVEKMSNNGIRIMEHGFNKTENKAIKCGDKG